MPTVKVHKAGGEAVGGRAVKQVFSVWMLTLNVRHILWSGGGGGGGWSSGGGGVGLGGRWRGSA